ncbi:MAG: UDP-N-acetylglucosamine 1-carboxyvinyltransferase [Oscillospiraceae bacterium]|nr:UDP-N-acetylglucosamine 1-carboxyvinyltransferase [Oscillospiraceae bacterium]
MDIWKIRGGRRLSGEQRVQGSKNASLPILAATLLCPGPVELHKVPDLLDVDTALEILRCLGCRTEKGEGRACVDCAELSGCSIPPELMERMRSSVIFLGPLLARCGQGEISLPGGCRLGKRPIDLHLSALRQMGARIVEEEGRIVCLPSRLRGTDVVLPFPSVGATENVMLAACGAAGETKIRGAAREPEIVALQRALRAMGAQVSGAGSDTVTVAGGRSRHSACVCVPPDRIAAATLCCACASAGGKIWLTDCDPGELSAIGYFLNRAGCDMINKNGRVGVSCQGRLRPIEHIVTAPYPGFPTDVQPLLMAALLRADGESRFTENIFEARYRHVPALRKLGADIRVDGREALVRGTSRLHGAAVEATDLRGGAAMILAGLAAEGETLVYDIGHIRRGYEGLDDRLRALGADLSVSNKGEDYGRKEKTERHQP